MTEREKMIAGQLYDALDAELKELRARAYRLCAEYNATVPGDGERGGILARLLAPGSHVPDLTGPVRFDYGSNTTFGERCYANYNLIVLDCAPVTLGKGVLIGPNCTLATALHPLLPDERATALEYAEPIVIGDDCWLASNVTVCAGVHIGEGSVIGAGSVVTRDVPPHTLAAGVPCRPLRSITPEDSVFRPSSQE